jgi:hypothetical protein
MFFLGDLSEFRKGLACDKRGGTLWNQFGQLKKEEGRGRKQELQIEKFLHPYLSDFWQITCLCFLIYNVGMRK